MVRTPFMVIGKYGCDTFRPCTVHASDYTIACCIGSALLLDVHMGSLICEMIEIRLCLGFVLSQTDVYDVSYR